MEVSTLSNRSTNPDNSEVCYCANSDCCWEMWANCCSCLRSVSDCRWDMSVSFRSKQVSKVLITEGGRDPEDLISPLSLSTSNCLNSSSSSPSSSSSSSSSSSRPIK